MPHGEQVKAKDSSSSPPTGVGQLLLQQDTQDTTAFRKQLQDLNPEDLKALKSRFRRKTARIVLRIRGIDNFRGSSATALAQILNMDESEVARMAESISGLYQQRL